MGTLHVARLTPRVVVAREVSKNKAKINWLSFKKALIRRLRADQRTSHLVKGELLVDAMYWRQQLYLWNGGVRDTRINPIARTAAEFSSRFPMGH